MRGAPIIRRPIAFSCASDTLAGTLDLPADRENAGQTGLLLVSGGNEIRSGAFRGQALLAARLAQAGHPVLRYDRRGVGDSAGANRGFAQSEADIRAALAALRAQCPALAGVVAFGNCDAASALMLAGGAGADALVLSNPWTIEGASEDSGASALPPPAAIRARYLAKLRNPAELTRLLRGGVNVRKLAGGLAAAIRPAAPAPAPDSLAARMAAGLARFSGPVTILLADADRTAQAFAALWPRGDARIARCPGASHAFVEEDARAWLEARVLAALRG